MFSHKNNFFFYRSSLKCHEFILNTLYYNWKIQTSLIISHSVCPAKNQLEKSFEGQFRIPKIWPCSNWNSFHVLATPPYIAIRDVFSRSPRHIFSTILHRTWKRIRPWPQNSMFLKIFYNRFRSCCHSSKKSKRHLSNF